MAKTRAAKGQIAAVFALTLAVACGDGGGREPGEAPRSLDGTEVDGRFAFDADGELVFDDAAQRTFDYFLTADGELGPRDLDDWVAEQVRGTVGGGQAYEQVIDAWYAYRMFRAKAAATLEDPTLVEHPEQAEVRLLAALELHLGDTPFATAERQRIERGFALQRAFALSDERARAVELARLDAEDARAFADSRAGRYVAGRKAIERARLADADAETITALRRQHFDALEPGAATRLAALDIQRTQWLQRVSEFRAARERLRDRFDGSTAELDAAIGELEIIYFSPTERRRLRALDMTE
jgi:lipase chaperone LimK